MRRRVLITYLSLLGVVLVAFLIPLAVTIASRETQGVFIDRVNDTTRFAGVAEGAMRNHGRVSALQGQIAEYDRLYGIGVAVVQPDLVIRIASRGGIEPADKQLNGQVMEALSGSRAQPAGIVWPWQSAPMVVAQPIGNPGTISGCVVTVSPTDKLRASIWHQWAVLAVIGLVILLVGAVAAVPVTRWLARPLNELDEVTHAMSRGELTERVHDDTGPPELRRFASSFNTMADRLATLIERQRAFISYASHQLRTPLATVRLRVENLGDVIPPDSEEEHRMVLEEVDRLSAIFEALLTFVRTGAERAELITVDAGAIADARLVAWQAVAEHAGVTLVRSGAETAPVRAACQTLDQTLDALVHNAIKYCGAGSRVVIAVRPSVRWVDVHVIDDGEGMSDEALSRAMQPFWRHPTDRHVAGAGLGLAIANALVTASGGELTLRRAKTRGVDARIRLELDSQTPLSDIPPPPERPVVPIAQKAAVGGTQGRVGR
ncbi:MAG: HAMP domain-containing sensor histidine kinase [Actinocatenispora sp.]